MLRVCTNALTRVFHVLARAGLLLYLLDVTFRCAQQAQPVRITKSQPCKSATLATLHFDADPFTPIKPVQVGARFFSSAVGHAPRVVWLWPHIF